jgi:hypothetical protein
MTMPANINQREYEKFIDTGTLPAAATLERPLTQAMAYTGAGMTEYVGKAEPGTAQSMTGWQIMKLTYSGTNVIKIEWASGNANFDKIWDSRAGYVYS